MRRKPKTSFWRGVDRTLNHVYAACGYAAACFLVTIGLLVCASIVTRLFSVYVPGLTEYSGYAMAAASFLALAYTFQHNGHIRVDMIIGKTRGRVRRAFELWTLFVASLACLYLAWHLGRLVYVSWRFEERSEGADAILIWLPQSLALLGGVALAVCVVHRFVKTLACKERHG